MPLQSGTIWLGKMQMGLPSWILGSLRVTSPR